MPNKTFNARVQMKRDTSANWTSNNPVLLQGEIIIVDTDAGEVRFKVGNGTSTYTQLPYTDEAIISKMLSLSGGTMTGNINMNGNVVTGLGAPVNATDAVRQQDLEVLSDEIDGIIAGTSPITLPIATDVRVGGVKTGDNVDVAEDGTISVDLSGYATDSEVSSQITSAQLALIGTGSATATTIKGAVDEAQNYADSAVESGLNTLNVDDAPVGTQFVTAVSQIDGMISVTRRVLSAVDIPNIQMSQVTGLTEALGGAGGVDIVVQSAQPSGQSSGDFWYQVV